MPVLRITKLIDGEEITGCGSKTMKVTLFHNHEHYIIIRLWMHVLQLIFPVVMYNSRIKRLLSINYSGTSQRGPSEKGTLY